MSHDIDEAETEIEITPRMIAAGLEVMEGEIALDFVEYLEGSRERLLRAVFPAMLAARHE